MNNESNSEIDSVLINNADCNKSNEDMEDECYMYEILDDDSEKSTEIHNVDVSILMNKTSN